MNYELCIIVYCHFVALCNFVYFGSVFRDNETEPIAPSRSISQETGCTGFVSFVQNFRSRFAITSWGESYVKMKFVWKQLMDNEVPGTLTITRPADDERNYKIGVLLSRCGELHEHTYIHTAYANSEGRTGYLFIISNFKKIEIGIYLLYAKSPICRPRKNCWLSGSSCACVSDCFVAWLTLFLLQL